MSDVTPDTIPQYIAAMDETMMATMLVVRMDKKAASDPTSDAIGFMHRAYKLVYGNDDSLPWAATKAAMAKARELGFTASGQISAAMAATEELTMAEMLRARLPHIVYRSLTAPWRGLYDPASDLTGVGTNPITEEELNPMTTQTDEKAFPGSITQPAPKPPAKRKATATPRAGKPKAEAKAAAPKAPKFTRDDGVKLGDVTYVWHPIAQVFPLIAEESDEFDGLVKSIKQNGQREKIRTYGTDDEGRVYILDGRNRLLACRAAKVEPEFVEFEGDEKAAAEYVNDENAHRRHLTKAQLLAAVTKLRDDYKLSVRTIAKTLHVSKSAVGRKVKGTEGTVTGADGRTHKASKPTAPRTQRAPRTLPDPAKEAERAELAMTMAGAADHGKVVLRRVFEALGHIDQNELATAVRALGPDFMDSIEIAETLNNIAMWVTNVQRFIEHGAEREVTFAAEATPETREPVETDAVPEAEHEDREPVAVGEGGDSETEPTF